jgi:hypothetical protein
MHVGLLCRCLLNTGLKMPVFGSQILRCGLNLYFRPIPSSWPITCSIKSFFTVIKRPKSFHKFQSVSLCGKLAWIPRRWVSISWNRTRTCRSCWKSDRSIPQLFEPSQPTYSRFGKWHIFHYGVQQMLRAGIWIPDLSSILMINFSWSWAFHIWNIKNQLTL